MSEFPKTARQKRHREVDNKWEWVVSLHIRLQNQTKARDDWDVDKRRTRADFGLCAYMLPRPVCLWPPIVYKKLDIENIRNHFDLFFHAGGEVVRLCTWSWSFQQMRGFSIAYRKWVDETTTGQLYQRTHTLRTAADGIIVFSSRERLAIADLYPADARIFANAEAWGLGMDLRSLLRQYLDDQYVWSWIAALACDYSL
jgi:hypothetical protein